MNYRAHIGVGEEIDDVVLAGLHIHFDLGKAGNVGKCRAIARVIVLRGRQKALSSERHRRRLSPPVEVGGYFVAIVDAAELNRVLRGLCQSHAGATALAKYALVGNIVILWLAAELLGCNLLEFLPGIHRCRVGSACHRVSRLAAAGDAGEREVFGRVAPCNVALLPRYSENFGSRAMYVDDRLCSQVADSGLEVHTAIRLDNEETIESDRAANITAERYADAAHLCADPLRRARDPLTPFELLCPAVEGFPEERACRIRPLAFHFRPEWRLALRTIDSADGHLVEPEFARRFRDDRLHNNDALQSSRCALCTPRRGIRQNSDTAPAHGFWLVEERHDTAGCGDIAICVVGTVVRDDEHVERDDPPVLGKADFHPPQQTGPGAADESLLLPADPHHHRRIRLLRYERRNNQRHAR